MGTNRRERLLPQNVDAESAVLGSILIDEEALIAVADFLRPDDFYRDAHRILFEVMIDLHNEQTRVDFVTLCDALQQREKLAIVGGETYISSLVNQVPTSANAVYYGRIVERTSILRRLIRAASDIVGMAYETEDENAMGVVEQAEQLIFQISERATSLQEDISLARVLDQYTEKLQKLASQRGIVTGVPTGFNDLDRLTGGLQPSDLILVAARPAVGKTSWALNLAYNAAVLYEQRVGIFSIEMSEEQLAMRLLAMDSGIDLARLRVGNIEDDEWEKVFQAVGRLEPVMIRIDPTSALSPARMRSRARRWVADYGIDLIIVDYLQLMQPDEGKKKQENRVQIIDEISRSLKLLARELNIPIVALAQLSRAVESRQSKIPMLSDLRESGGLEQNADIVLFIYRDEVYHPETERKGLADIIVAKHRNGETGNIVLRFEPQLTRFHDLADEVVTSLDEFAIEEEKRSST
jgi:replicative DNA helicase